MFVVAAAAATGIVLLRAFWSGEYHSYEYNASAQGTGKVHFDLKELGLHNGSWQLAYIKDEAFASDRT